MASFRHKARQCVVQAIFAHEFHGGDPESLLRYVISELEPDLHEEEFAYKLLNGVVEKKDEINKIIKEKAPEWPVEKIARLDHAILLVGIYELLHAEDIPSLVAINEAVELAKEFGDTNSSKFVNGVLSAILHEYKPEEVENRE